jgi:hypothetical protein
MKVYKYLSVLVTTLAQRSLNTEFAVISDVFENQTCETYQLFARCKYEGVHSIVNQLSVLCLCVWQCVQLGLLWGLGFCPPHTSIALAPFTVSGKFVLSFWALSCSVSKGGGENIQEMHKSELVKYTLVMPKCLTSGGHFWHLHPAQVSLQLVSMIT